MENLSVLNAWWEGRLIGQFIREEDGPVRFVYQDDAPPTPISLSLPRTERASRNAAQNFLKNLLPESADFESYLPLLLSRLGIGSLPNPKDYFSIIGLMGHDLPGALSVLPPDLEPSNAPAPTRPLSEDVIAGRLALMREADTSWLSTIADRKQLPRFSLAGAQPKFSTALVSGRWWEPNVNLPSTHIFKPESNRHRGIELLEAATLKLATELGLPAAAARVEEFYDQTSLVIERFDRVISGDGTVRRIHAEDLAQALGISPARKYNASADQMLRLLVRNGIDPRPAIEQLVFSTFVGNADAHLKNYSVLLHPQSIEVSPLYDALPTAIYPQYDKRLAMRIGSANYVQAIQHSDWVKLATRSGVDIDLVLATVRRIATGVSEVGGDMFRQVGVQGALLDGVSEVFSTTTKHALS